jgi:hypothetical protein
LGLEINLSEPHEQMLEQLREQHGGEIDVFLRERVESEIHESFQQLRDG